MTRVAIETHNLGKLYRIGRPLRGLVASGASTIDRSLRRMRGQLESGSSDELLWALRNVDLTVEAGEVVGIIGRNGAGKSTLLKVLSRITDPTEGQAVLHGRVGSLLEVGTGFHPELTGRENVFMNGAIMGMKREEIAARLDAIVEFAGVERFIDMPVKRYSSGMHVRLGFAVAAHLDPDILLVDEVLAVGDAEFQKRCLGTLSDAARSGRTVLFVSHNMAAIQDFCTRAYWIHDGMVAGQGEVRSVIQQYLSNSGICEAVSLVEHERRKPTCQSILTAVRLRNALGPSATIQSHGPFIVEVDCDADEKLLPNLSLGIMVRDALGTNLMATNMNQYHQMTANEAGRYRITATFDRLGLSPGTYSLSLYIGNGSYDLDIIEDAIHFEVLWDSSMGLAFPPPTGWGPMFALVDWQVEPSPMLPLLG